MYRPFLTVTNEEGRYCTYRPLNKTRQTCGVAGY